LRIGFDLWATVLDPLVEDAVLLETGGHPAERPEGPRLAHLEEAQCGGAEAEVGEVSEDISREEPCGVAGEEVFFLGGRGGGGGRNGGGGGGGGGDGEGHEDGA